MNYKNLTYSEISEKFFQLEEKNNLLYLEIDKVFPWQIARIAIFLQIVDHFISGNTENSPKSKTQKITNFLHRFFINCIFFNPFLDFKKDKVLVIESGRKYADGNSSIDIYTAYLVKKLEKEKISFTTYEINYTQDLLFFKRDWKIKHLDFIILFSKIKKYFIQSEWTKVEEEKVQLITKEINAVFGVNLNIHHLFKEEIKKFKSEYSLYDLLLRLKKPEEIYITNSCEKAALISAAKKSGVLVKELQHGLMSDKDVISNFPFSPEESLIYFPDQFYIWDNVDMFFGKLPIKPINIHYFKNEHLQKWVDKTQSVQKDKNNILVVSQPYNSEEIQKFIIENKKILSDFSITYKIHPAENEQNFHNFKNYFKDYPNIKFINNEESMYILLKKAKYALGIYSSALFEASAFNCEVILLNLPGVEMSFPLLKNKNNKLIDINSNLSNLLIK